MSSHIKSAAPKVKGKISFKAGNQRPAGKGLVSGGAGGKRKRMTGRGTANDDEDDDDEDPDTEADDEMTDGAASSEGDEMDTDDELQAASKTGKSKKTAKRKRRATSPSLFGATLQNLLGNAEEDDEEGSDQEEPQAAPSEKKKPSTSTTLASGQPAILSLAPHIRRGAQSSRLNEKASRLALAAKRKREDRARVIDVIGSWGAPGQLPKTSEGDEKPIRAHEEADNLQSWLNEGGVQGYEKRLRKSAQRGVVKLFNAIRAAQNTTEVDVKEQEEGIADEKSASKNDKALNKSQNTGIRTDNALGGKSKAVTKLSKDNFFDLLRAGTKA